MEALLSITKHSLSITSPSRLLLALTSPDKIHTKSVVKTPEMRGGERIYKVVRMTQNRSIAFLVQDWYMDHVIRTDMLITKIAGLCQC